MSNLFFEYVSTTSKGPQSGTKYNLLLVSALAIMYVVNAR